MRKRLGNPSNEEHDKDFVVYDWIEPPGATPHEAMLAVEARVAGLKLHNRGDGVANGYVNTSLRPDGSLYVCVHLYRSPCDNACGRHPGLRMDVAPDLNPGMEAKLAGTEHGQGLGRGKAVDLARLVALGFVPGDGPLKE